MYLIIGRAGRYIRLSASAYNLLRSVAAGVSFEILAEHLSKQQNRPVQAAELEAAYQRVVQDIEAIESKANQNPFGFWFRVPILPTAVVVPIARLFAFCFNPIIAILLLIGIIAVAIFRAQDISIVTPLFLAYEESLLLPIYILFLISVLFHEFGHASAAMYFGLRPNNIGFAFYWIFPVFYSDVNAVWQLNRWQRVVVDLGGVFFQLIVAAIYLLIYAFTGWVPAKEIVPIILYSCLFTLNPILKFDGYWILADALGVVNLWQQPGRVLRYVYDRIRGRPTAPLPWPGWVVVAMFIYTVLSIVFWCYFTWVLVRVFLAISQNYIFVLFWAFSSLFSPPYTLALDRIMFLLFPTSIMLATMLTLFYVGKLVLGIIRSFIGQTLRRDQAK